MRTKKDIKDFIPFKGLKPFTTEDSDIFFGRETESDEVILKLLKNRYITVIGAAGIGKSSLIFGGILPKIRKISIRESSEWRIVSLRPESDPFGNLAMAISDYVSDSGQKRIEKEMILSELLDNPGNLSEILGKYSINHDENVLLVIDQFEDLFRYFSPGKSEISNVAAKAFVDFLIKSVIKPDVNIFVIISMRSEYLGECTQYKGLTIVVNNSNYLVPDMELETMRKVITDSIEYSGAKIDPKLVERLIYDIRDQTFKLSVLQHTMMRTWVRWQELNDPDKTMDISDYEYIGTMSYAISLHGEEVYEELSQRGKEICSTMFKTIVRKSPDVKGIKHSADINTIKSIACCTSEELTEVINKFRTPSLSFITPPEDFILSDDSKIDLQSECILQHWDRLRVWVDNEASSAEVYLRLSESSALYQQGKMSLYMPPDLQTAINWRNQYKPTLGWAIQYNPAFERAMVYLRTSEKAFIEEEQNRIRLQKRKTKRFRLITRMLGIAVLVAIGLTISEYAQRTNAERQSILAEKQRMQAIKGKAIADSFAIVVLKHNIISDSTASVAIQDAEEARKQKIVAEIQKNYAERNAGKAIEQRNIAKEQLSVTQRMRMLSVGKSMALKSLQLNGQKDLQTLLAYQAWVFNKNNKGPGNDADIYAGLYNVALQYGDPTLKTFRGHSGDIKSIAFLPGSNEFFTSGNDGKVLKWSSGGKDQTLQIIYSGSDIIDVLAVSPDASWLACGSSNSSIRMIPLKGNVSGYEMAGHSGGIKSLVFSYDSKYLYSAALDGKVLKWDIAARTSMNVATGSMEISSIDISSNGNYIAGISTNGNVLIWNPDKKTDNFRIETTGKNIKVVKFNTENNLLALGDADGNVELWDIDLHKKLAEVKAHDGQVNDIQFNSILNQMATAGNDKKIKIFNIKDPADLTEPPVSLADNDGFVLVMRFSPDGQMLVSGESGAGNNLLGRPSHSDYLAQNMCDLVSRNMTREEWNIYVGKDIPLEKTCKRNFNIKIEPVKSLSKRN